MFAHARNEVFDISDHSHRINWNAIFAATVAAIAVGSLLNLLGIGLGLIGFNPDHSQLHAFGMGAIFWLVISTLAYSLLSGWIAGKFARCVFQSEGVLHGLVAWSLATIFTIFVMASSGGFIFNASMQIFSNTIAKAVAQTPLKSINTESATTKNEVNVLGKNIGNGSGLLDTAKQAISSNEPQHISSAIADDSSQVQPSKQATAEVSSHLGRIALLTFLILLIGSLASMWGGWLGAKQEAEIKAV